MRAENDDVVLHEPRTDAAESCRLARHQEPAILTDSLLPISSFYNYYFVFIVL